MLGKYEFKGSHKLISVEKLTISSFMINDNKTM